MPSFLKCALWDTFSKVCILVAQNAVFTWKRFCVNGLLICWEEAANGKTFQNYLFYFNPCFVKLLWIGTEAKAPNRIKKAIKSNIHLQYYVAFLQKPNDWCEKQTKLEISFCSRSSPPARCSFENRCERIESANWYFLQCFCVVSEAWKLQSLFILRCTYDWVQSNCTSLLLVMNYSFRPPTEWFILAESCQFQYKDT